MGKWTRRAFIASGTLVGGGLLVGVGVGVAIRPGHRTPELAKIVESGDEVLVNAWVKILPDNSIKVIVPHSEMGQGVHTALPMMLADEMDADWSTVSMEQAPAHPEYATFHLARHVILPGKVPGIVEDTLTGVFLKASEIMSLQITGGSFSVRSTGQLGMRTAGAAAREMLINAAAEEWQVPASEIRAENSYLHHDASKRSAPFANFAKLAASLKGPEQPTLKTPDQFKIMGQSVERLDIPPKVDGSAVFGTDIDLPGMKYAAVKAAPVFGSTVVSIDSAAAEKMKGVIKIVDLDTGVGVIADSYWQATKALQSVLVTYTESAANKLSTAGMFEQFGQDMDAAVANGKEQEDLVKGDARGTLAQSDNVVEAEYRVPFLAHATMEPMNCTAWVHDGQVELWAGLQNPLGTRDFIANKFGYETDKVTIHNVYLGGGFGRRTLPDYPQQGVQLANALPGVPVKMIWSREEDIQQDHYRQAVISRFKAGLDESGTPISWENQFIDKHDPVEAPYIPYAIDNQFIHYTSSPTHVPFGAWRSVDHSQHAFFTESFIDELAAAAGKDPYHYRRDLLAEEPRIRKVLDSAAKMAGWGKSMPAHWAQGIALQSSFNTIVAQVVDIDMSSGKPRVDKVFCAADAGFVISPDGFIAQMESGIVFGLTAALYGDITLKDGAIVESNFHNYKMVRMNNSPDIEVKIINSGEPMGGAGEPGTPPIAPAVTNAIFAATGKRIRELPTSKHDGSYSLS
ncbi:MAG: molybdopterin-dependent oxidoreductase [Porticoccaceae bacterium]|nr:molybdopterin-dependent oxidoreductase [Porticoccaceae bacterium]MDG1307078.1 molybdopterin-dependent oxidoreductase [Porticoccaceae bacterium]